MISSESLSEAEQLEAASSWLGKALIRAFADVSERVRSMALELMHKQLTHHPDALLPVLPYAMPVLEERLYRDDNCKRAEPSEEVRLQLINVRMLPYPARPTWCTW
jgi:hypothetical protein